MTRPPLIRLAGSGTVPRAFAFAVLVVVTVFVIVWLASDPGAVLAALVPAVIAAGLAVRSLFVGVLLAPDAVVVRAWFRDFRYARGGLQAVTAVPYWTFLSKDDPILSLLKFTPDKGWVREISATVAWRDRTAAHAAKIRDHLGLPSA
jgi:hypothetical protein